jgi:hypothetical protein
MTDKKYSINDLKNCNQTYNQMIDFLKRTIPDDQKIELMNKFEERATEDDDRYNGLKILYRINEVATISTLMAAVFGLPGCLGATIVSAPYTLVYYHWCKAVMKGAKSNKEDCIRFFKKLSESVNNVQYPFGVGRDEDIDKMESYLKNFKGFKDENYSEIISKIKIEEEKDMNI